MSRNIRVKPGRGQSMVGFLGGIVFCFLGFFVVIPTFSIFGVVWTLFAVIITIVNGYNAFSERGVASHEITIDEDTEYTGTDYSGTGYTGTENRKSPEERLGELQGLYEKGLITSEEYQNKRRQILNEL